ncbi:MAG TPA: hypothetical protein VL225_07905 [Vicinamibacterales bacterium]|jgi:hypothetical protein|nr:hypothetical protein [Vicinamibacterales bacterium]
MQDGVLFVMFNDQGSPRGERELRAANWWMGMAQRKIAGGTLTIDANDRHDHDAPREARHGLTSL